MKRAIVLIFILCVSISFAQQPVITKLDKKTVRGTLFGKKGYNDFSYIIIKKNKRYLRSVYPPNKVGGIMELSGGKWKIKNDTLILIEKYYKQKYPGDNQIVFSLFGKKSKRTTVAKLILYKGKWMEIEDNKFTAVGVYDQYIVKGLEMKLKNKEEGD